jgi:CRISPR-associated protein Csb2
MLALEIEFLTSVVFAGRVTDDSKLDWPPQPERAFSALVASWGAHGNDPDERAALEWLERQDPPQILASPTSSRSALISFVPPNDFKTSKSGFDVIPARRSRQARRFPGGTPHCSTMHLVWSTASIDEKTFRHLDALARDTSYIGHSTSLTRCRFIDQQFDLSNAVRPERVVYEGRLEELERLFRKGERPNPVWAEPNITTGQPARSIFSPDWIVLADNGGQAPSLRAFPLVARKVRDALMGAYDKVVGEVPEWISGHAPGGRPTDIPHLAVVPLADVNWAHSEGRLLGCAIVLPRGRTLDELAPAIRSLLDGSNDDWLDGDRSIELHYGTGCWYLDPTDQPQRASQKPGRWTARARIWTTATPIVIDRFPHGRDRDARQRQIEASIERACGHVGLPKPAWISIAETSPLRGAPSAIERRDARPWERWHVPSSLAGRPLVHATIGFDEVVEGPVILGAGRYVGLGLCLPHRENQS